MSDNTNTNTLREAKASELSAQAVALAAAKVAAAAAEAAELSAKAVRIAADKVAEAARVAEAKVASHTTPVQPSPDMEKLRAITSSLKEPAPATDIQASLTKILDELTSLTEQVRQAIGTK